MKQLKFTFEGKDYTLEFTRKTVEQMERNGFVTKDVTEKPMSTLPALFAGAFLANHRYEKKERVDKIFENMGNKSELIAKLVEMYNETITTLLDEPADGKNVEWTTSW